MTSPLPPINEDPAFATAQTAHGTYTAAASAARGDFRTTDLAKSESIVQAWENANATISGAWSDLTQRRQERLAVLEALVPVGPNVPANASPADKAVLHQVFRVALDQARVAAGNGTSDAGLRAMLADAERFADDTLRRAAMTAAVDANMTGVVSSWCAQLGLTAQLDELLALRASLSGTGDLTEHLFTTQAFSPIAQPAEAYNLPALLAAAEQSRTDAQRASNVSRPWH